MSSGKTVVSMDDGSDFLYVRTSQPGVMARFKASPETELVDEGIAEDGRAWAKFRLDPEFLIVPLPPRTQKRAS